MIHGDVTTGVDCGRCTGCGWCVAVCPGDTLGLQDGKAVVTGDHCLQCGHCAAVCPAEAIRVGALDGGASTLATAPGAEAYLPPGEFDLPALTRLMRSRRSCRCYLDKPVDRALLDDLVRIGMTAPSGTNSQRWTFTVCPTRASVMRLGTEVGDVFRKLNRLAEKPALRLLLRMIGSHQLESYYRRYYPRIERSLKEWEQSGRDRLFHQATAVMVIGSKPGGGTPAEDALLATQNILLAAHAMGLGTCLIGFAVAALRRDPGILPRFGIPVEETIHSVIALGYPGVKFLRPAGRKVPTVRYVEA